MESPLKKIDRKDKEGEEQYTRPPLKKKVRLSKVAEMVLVLAALGKMRSGDVGPTDAEAALMNESTAALAGICEGFAPGDVFPKDVFGRVIDDLGLDRLKEEKPGLRPPKTSITDRMLASKRKLEKLDEFSLSKTQSSQQGSSAVTIEGRRPPQMSQMPNSNQVGVSTGIFPSGTPSSHGITGTSTSSPYQLPSSEIRPVISNALSSSHFVSSGLPRTDKPQLRLDAFPAQAKCSANSSVRTPSWSMQTQSVHPMNMAFTAEQVANLRSGLSPQMTSRTANSQTSTALPSQSTKQVHASLASTHSEIGKIIQKLLQPRVPEQRKWVPPSREYMNKALTCQVCTSTVTETDSILICDACEKGYHLKCLQTTKVPEGEWHCRKCLSLSNGKPLPPKYGRVMRNTSMSKTSSSNSDVTATSSKNVSTPSEVGQSKAAVNGSLSMQNIPTGDATHGHQLPGAQVKAAKKVQENDIVSRSFGSDADDKVSSGTTSNILIKTSGSAYVSSVRPPVDRVCDEKIVLNPNTPAKSDVDSDNSLAAFNAQDGKTVDFKSDPSINVEMVSDSSHESLKVPKDHNDDVSLPNGENTMFIDSKELDGGEIIDPNSSLPKERAVLHDYPSEIASASESTIHAHPSSDGLHVVDWVGDPVQDLDDKLQYGSCNINGHEYRVMDHVLIRFQNDKLVPSKLLTMWEDKGTKKKWVSVTRCYFPEDFPETVGRLCGLETNEVCESCCESTMMAGLIESPCEVLPSRKYAEEVERRRHQNDNLLPPLYLCRWIYDEAKGLFRDISC